MTSEVSLIDARKGGGVANKTSELCVPMYPICQVHRGPNVHTLTSCNST